MYTYLQGNEYEDIAAAWDWNCMYIRDHSSAYTDDPLLNPQ